MMSFFLPIPVIHDSKLSTKLKTTYNLLLIEFNSCLT